MTSLDKDSFTVNSLGSQAQSQRTSGPKYHLPKSGRHNYEKVHVSEEHSRVSKLGRASPIGGPIYELGSTLNLKTGVSFSSGTRNPLPRTSMTRNLPGENGLPVGHPDDIPSNDALDIQVDSQKYRYRREQETIIGTEPRGKLNGAELLKNHSAAFFGRASPGPASVGGEYGPSLGPTKPTFAPAGPFGVKTKVKKDWTSLGDNPESVGPGTFERKDVALGPQYLSRRRNQTVNRFPGQPKFPKTLKDDGISAYDAARSCMAGQVLSKNKSEPSVNFACDNRDIRSKTKLCMTKADEGPRATMPKFTASMPCLPPERHIMASGIG